MNNLLGSFILERRKELGLSQKDIAEHLNVSIPTVYLWEKNERLPDLSLLGGLANILKVDLESLINCETNLINNIDNENSFDINNFSKNFTILRKLSNHSLSSLAEILNIRYQKISKWENGESLPSINELKECAKIFNVTIQELYYGKSFKENIIQEEKVDKIIIEKKNKTQTRFNFIFTISLLIVFASVFFILKNGILNMNSSSSSKNSDLSNSIVINSSSSLSSSSSVNSSNITNSSNKDSSSSFSSNSSVMSSSTLSSSTNHNNSSSSSFKDEDNSDKIYNDEFELVNIAKTYNSITVTINSYNDNYDYSINLFDGDKQVRNTVESNNVTFTDLKIGYEYQLKVEVSSNSNVIRRELYDVKTANYILNGVEYRINENGLMSATTLESNSINKIIITSEIFGIEVSQIDPYAFKNKYIHEVEIPGSVKIIGDHAFDSCTLSKVTLNEGIIEIKEYAFYNNLFKEVYIPSSVQIIGQYAFTRELSSIKEFKYTYIPFASLPLQYHNNFTSSQIVFSYSHEEVFENCKYSISTNYEATLVTVPTSIIEFSVPDVVNGYKVTKIASYAFKDSSVTKVTMSKNIEIIDDYAFSGAKQLKNIIFAEDSNLKTIGYYAFNLCEKLEGVNLPNGIERINDFAFIFSRAKYAYIPSSCIYIGESAFPNSTVFLLENSSIPETWVKIGDSNRNWCDQTGGIDLANLAIYFNINENNYQNVNNSIYIIKDNYAVLACYYGSDENILINDYISFNNINYEVKELGMFTFSLLNAKTIKLPNTLEIIRKRSIYVCPNLLYIKIPNSVTLFEKYGVFNLANLKYILIPDSNIVIENYAFNNINDTVIIYYEGNAIPSSWGEKWNNKNYPFYLANQWSYDEQGNPVAM